MRKDDMKEQDLRFNTDGIHRGYIRPICPECESHNVIPILWAYNSVSYTMVNEGEAVYGDSIGLAINKDHLWLCKDCEHKFGANGEVELRYIYTIKETAKDIIAFTDLDIAKEWMIWYGEAATQKPTCIDRCILHPFPGKLGVVLAEDKEFPITYSDSEWVKLTI